MQISLIIVLIVAEALLILIGLSITLGIMLLRKTKANNNNNENPPEPPEAELDAIELGNSYIEYLEQAMLRNDTKAKQQVNIENESPESETNGDENNLEEDKNTSDLDNEETNTEDENAAPAPDEAQSKLLLAREQFLLMEKAAAEKSEHEIHFWNSIYDGMKELLKQFSSTETIHSTSTETQTNTLTVTESKEKVFYIETQGKKIDGEVNKLKDIIFEQENTLSSMKKAIANASDDNTEDSELLNTLQEQMTAIERQLSESKMCMEVLEMENNRLQKEVNQMDSRHAALFSDDTAEKTEDSGSLIDLDQMREVVEQQENKIQQLVETIESLEIDASQATKLKDTISDFASTAKEMMSCIAILEEENDKLQVVNKNSSEEKTESDAASSEDIDALKSTISKLEEDIIKKDVAQAKLQDEFTSMETEYLAMYEAMHGDNS